MLSTLHRKLLDMLRRQPGKEETTFQVRSLGQVLMQPAQVPSEASGQQGLQGEFQVSQDYMEKPCKNKQWGKKKKNNVLVRLHRDTPNNWAGPFTPNEWAVH